MSERILLVEDEQRLRRVLQLVLSDAGYTVKIAADGGEGIKVWQQWQPHLVITDLKMKPLDGLEVLRYGSEQEPDIPCLILTAFGTVAGAVEAMKNGAYDFLTKPIDHGQLLEVVQLALADSELKQGKSDQELIGDSEVMTGVRREIRLLAETDSAVLIQGESGTGKELVARGIHATSSRSSGPFVRINCAAIPRELLESELFGHRKGAFTGATENREGAFMRADGGVLFLDEIGDLSLELQPKLLHAVEEKEITPVGADIPQPVCVKILSATNQDLEAMIGKKQFRLDLFYRLNTMQLLLPPLRERGGDVELLADFFLHGFGQKFTRPQLRLGQEVLRFLKSYDWPGNVRELRNVMERAALICREPELSLQYLPEAISGQQAIVKGKDGENLYLDLVAREQELLHTALQQCNWNQSQAARKLNISRSALRYRLKKYGIKR